MLQIAPNWSVNNLSSDWESVIGDQIKEPYFQGLIGRVQSCDGPLTPKIGNVFRAFELTDFNDVKVVIIGQDPYPRSGNATGLAFGIPYGTDLPRSLINIANEIEICLNEPDYDEDSDTVIIPPTRLLDRTNMTLEGWAKQGVLMLNSCLTGQAGRIGAHKGIGWETFTDQIIFSLRMRNKPTVYMLWGEAAKSKYDKLCAAGGQGMRNSIALFSTHPSPLSFNSGPLIHRFQGCRHFNKANRFFGQKGLKLINWLKTGV